MKSGTEMAIHKNIGYDIVTELVSEGSSVLDLGCGDGALLALLHEKKNIKGYGVEISEEGLSLCLEKGLYCYQADIDEGLTDYRDNSFDFVILNQTLQSTKRPAFIIREILRIGRKAIVSFPNFAHHPVRRQLSWSGKMPKSNAIPYEWYDTPNIHMITIKDFERYCHSNGYSIEKRLHFKVNREGKSCKVAFAPNYFAEYGMFMLSGFSS
ncbi:MAG: methionine biosynthesis protein MetW [Leptospirales bacterium]|nr:methionine biosynthesis protein MetW [Leptospirales bacterium]